MEREEGSGWGTHVYLWQIHFDIRQNQYNIVKLKNKIKKKDFWKEFSCLLIYLGKKRKRFFCFLFPYCGCKIKVNMPEGWYGEGGGKRIQEGEHVYTCGRFMLIYGKTNTVL